MNFTKIISALSALIIAAALLSSCGGEQQPPEISTYSVDTTSLAETTSLPEESKEYTLDEMSPKTVDTALPSIAETDYNKIDKSRFQEVDEEDTLIEGTGASVVYTNGKAQYYVLSGNIVLTVYLDAAGDIEYTSCFDDTGKIMFIANDEYSWYFGENCVLDYVAYSFFTNNSSKVVSFYEPDGSRFAILAAGAYYDNDYNLISESDTLTLLKRIGDATEIK